jgi:heme exporter protein A
MLDVINLECVRGERRLFAALALRILPGTCLHVAGENGAGKTSLLRILVGLLEPTAGFVRWRGADIRRLREEFWRELVYVGHANGIKDDLTALENVRFARALRGTSGAVPVDDAGAALQALGLSGRANTPVRFLSQGQRRRVALARLLLAPAPPLWVLDEPFVALDARGVVVLSARIAQHLGGGGIVALTTHQEVPLPGLVQRLDLAPVQAEVA